MFSKSLTSSYFVNTHESHGSFTCHCLFSTTVVCMILTSQGNWKTAARAIRHTWAKRCHIPLIFYSKFPDYTSHEIYKTNGTVPLDVPEGKEHLTDKMYAALNYSYEKYKNVADFYVKLDDDVFLVWENFMVLVREFDPNNLIYFGRKDDPKLSKAGGTGYFLSKAAVPLMFGNGSACLRDFARNFTSTWEDMTIGNCLSDSESAREMPAGFLERWLYPSHNSRAKLKGPTPPESPYKFANRTGVDFGNAWVSSSDLNYISWNDMSHY